MKLELEELKNRLKAASKGPYAPYEKKRLIKELKLSYRTVKGLIQLMEDPGIADEDLIRYSDPDYYTFDNMVQLVKTADPMYQELIPEFLYEDEDFLIRAGIRAIPDGFIEGNEDIRIFTVKAPIMRIGCKAFSECRNLFDIIFPEHYSSHLIAIGDFAFRDCHSLIIKSVPQTVKYIGAGAFYKCNAIEWFRFPGKVTYIRPYTYYGCTSLKRVQTAPTIKVGASAFRNCISLTDVSGMAEEVGEDAFSGCSSLRRVDIASTIISQRSFAGCSSLISIHFRIMPVLIERDSFLGCSSIEKVTVNGRSYQLHGADGYCELVRHIRPSYEYLKNEKLAKKANEMTQDFIKAYEVEHKTDTDTKETEATQRSPDIVPL